MLGKKNGEFHINRPDNNEHIALEMRGDSLSIKRVLGWKDYGSINTIIVFNRNGDVNYESYLELHGGDKSPLEDVDPFKQSIVDTLLTESLTELMKAVPST